MNHPFAPLLLVLLPVAACSGPDFDPSRFAGTWQGELREARSGTRLPTTVEVTALGATLGFRVSIRGGPEEEFAMEIAGGEALLAETVSPRFGKVGGSLRGDGFLTVTGRDMPGPLDWFELAGTWSETGLEADADFGPDHGPGGKALLTLRR